MTTIVLAGRRIDAVDAATPRFPLDRVAAVRAELRDLFARQGATAVVASGACGADLLGLQVATESRLGTRMVLPFAHKRFRAESVTDRPGDWGPLFDQTYQAVKASFGIKTLAATHNRDRDFARTNRFLIREAQRLAGTPHDLLAVVVWDGQTRGPDDMTADFVALVQAAGMPVQTIRTLP